MTDGLRVGDVVVFNGDWFHRRRMPVPPMSERARLTVVAVGDGGIMCQFPPGYFGDDRAWKQVVSADWVERVEEG